MLNKQLLVILSIILLQQCATTTSQVSQDISTTENTTPEKEIKSD